MSQNILYGKLAIFLKLPYACKPDSVKNTAHIGSIKQQFKVAEKAAGVLNTQTRATQY